jgi:hypothetical protein
LDEHEPRREVRPELAPEPLSYTAHRRHFHLHSRTEQELDMLATGSNSWDLGFLGMIAGVAATSITTLTTVEMGPLVFAGFVSASMTSVVLPFAFALAAIRERRAVARTVAGIKGRRADG